ncbi:MAG TPA: site-specific integrase [Candidatus Angelobacter sp.]|nr:site-specific integrase [Candidatus Angelobacter sp.]
MQFKPIVKGDTRILRPCEYTEIRGASKTIDNQTRLDVLLLSGLRYVEARRLYDHPDWFDARFIHLPEFAQRKVRRKQNERWVRLSDKGRTVTPYFFKVRPLPVWNSWRDDLDRWATRAGLDTIGLSPKSTRKTYESWLVSSYPEKSVEIALSMGHTELTQLRHYVNMPFVQSDKEAMREWTAGWEN